MKFQLYRNNNHVHSRDEAVAILKNEAFKKNVADGMPVAIRYSDGSGYYHTLFGIRNSNDGEIEIFDNTFEIEKLINQKLGIDKDSESGNTIIDQLISLSGTPTDTSDSISVKGAKLYTDEKINNLNVNDTAVIGQYVSSVNENKGVITVTRANLPVSGVNSSIKDGDVVTGAELKNGVITLSGKTLSSGNVTREKKDGLTGDTVEKALIELSSMISSNATESKVIVTSDSKDNEWAAVYILKQGESEIGRINIPKDQFLSEAKFISAATKDDVAIDNTVKEGNPYLKFTWNISTNGRSVSYVDVSKLVDIYRGATGNTIDVTVNDYTVKAEIKKNAINKEYLAAPLQNEITSAITGVSIENNNLITKLATDGYGAFLPIEFDSGVTISVKTEDGKNLISLDSIDCGTY